MRIILSTTTEQITFDRFFCNIATVVSINVIEQIIPSLILIRVYSDDLSFTPWRSADSVSLYPRARIDWGVQVSRIVVFCSFGMWSESARFRSCDCSHNMSRVFLHSTKRAREFFAKVFFVLSDYSLYTIKAFWLSVCKLLICRSWSNCRN